MQKIKLTHNKYALIDDGDYFFIAGYKWSLHKQTASNILYASSWIGKKVVLMHRLIMGLKKGEELDHIDLNGLNNQKYNLRKCTRQENLRNRLKFRNSTSKFKGVYWDKNRHKWKCQINNDKKQINLGRYKSEIEAAKIYDKYAEKYHKEFAITNKMLGLL